MNWNAEKHDIFGKLPELHFLIQSSRRMRRDEIVPEAPPELTMEEESRRMEKVPAWAPGLVLRADGYACTFYRKD